MPNVVVPIIPNDPPQGIQAQLDLLYLCNPSAINKIVVELNNALEEVRKAQKELGGNAPVSGVTEQWVKDNFINADASTYTLATLADTFNYSNARLYKVFNETNMPTRDTYTLLSLGWTYHDSNNAPTLIASNLANKKLYYYQGTKENCTPEAWKEFAFVGDTPTVQPGGATVAPAVIDRGFTHLWKCFNDGWVEQGGYRIIATTSRTSIPLMIQMADDKYFITTTGSNSTVNNNSKLITVYAHGPTEIKLYATIINTSSQTAGGDLQYTWWEVKGYAA